MHITSGRLDGVSFKRAHAHGGDQSPRFIVLHDTAGRDRKYSSVEWFQSKECPHSAHFVVELDGTITQLVETDKRAWHAGESEWKGTRFLNSCSVGIEIVNPGKLDETGRAWFGPAASPGEIKHASSPGHGAGYWRPYTNAQIESVIRICKAVMAEYPDCNEIVTHWQISPGRKVDTNPLFPLDDVKRRVLEPEASVPVSEVGGAPQPAAPPAAPAASQPPASAKPATKLQTAKRSLSVRLMFGAVMAWIEKQFGFLAQMLPDVAGEVQTTVDPLTSLGSILKINMATIVNVVAIVTICVAIYRHIEAKHELERRRADELRPDDNLKQGD